MKVSTRSTWKFFLMISQTRRLVAHWDRAIVHHITEEPLTTESKFKVIQTQQEWLLPRPWKDGIRFNEKSDKQSIKKHHGLEYVNIKINNETNSPRLHVRQAEDVHTIKLFYLIILGTSHNQCKKLARLDWRLHHFVALLYWNFSI